MGDTAHTEKLFCWGADDNIRYSSLLIQHGQFEAIMHIMAQKVEPMGRLNHRDYDPAAALLPPPLLIALAHP
jgi:hypothetical protein